MVSLSVSFVIEKMHSREEDKNLYRGLIDSGMVFRVPCLNVVELQRLTAQARKQFVKQFGVPNDLIHKCLCLIFHPLQCCSAFCQY